MKLLKYLFIASGILLFSCSDDSQEDILDTDLREALINNGQRLHFFKQPSSDDFSAIPHLKIRFNDAIKIN